MIFLVLLACFVVVNCHGIMHEQHQPQPYKFGYTIKDKEGVQHRAEAGNGAGIVEGNYGFIDNKGLQRQVNYVAGHGGFRAAIKTNEPGTTGQSSAAVRMMSNDPYSHGAPVPYVSRLNDPVVPTLYESDGVYGFPTLYGHRAYGLAPYTPAHGAYGPAPYAPVLGHGVAAPLNYHGLPTPLKDGYVVAPYNGVSLEYGHGYGPKYLGGLAHSNLLGAGYRGNGGIINFGANLVGGQIRGFDSRFTSLLN